MSDGEGIILFWLLPALCVWLFLLYMRRKAGQTGHGQVILLMGWLWPIGAAIILYTTLEHVWIKYLWPTLSKDIDIL